MNANITLLSRPPIGFVVEGHGEYNCYPSLVCRAVEAKGFRVPRVNAGGYGSVVRHLRDQLTDLVLAYHPFHIMVTVDLKDLLDAGLYSDCGQLCTDLRQRARDWLNSAQDNPRLDPLPELISIVVQVQKFESWMMADIRGLAESGYLTIEEMPQFSNVDEEIPNPSAWLRKHVALGQNLKNPKCAKSVISCLDLTTMRERSRSFDKFCREVLLSYDSWSQACHGF